MFEPNMLGDRDVALLGEAIARKGNKFQIHWLTAWGFTHHRSWGRVLRAAATKKKEAA